MRNLRDYPILAEEVTKTVASIPESPSGMVGGVNNFIRNRIIAYFENPENMTAILKELEA